MQLTSVTIKTIRISLAEYDTVSTNRITSTFQLLPLFVSSALCGLADLNASFYFMAYLRKAQQTDRVSPGRDNLVVIALWKAGSSPRKRIVLL